MQDKEKILEDIQSLIQDIDKCTGDIVQGRVTGDVVRVSEALYDMESLIVKAHQELSFLYDYIEEGGKDEDTD